MRNKRKNNYQVIEAKNDYLPGCIATIKLFLRRTLVRSVHLSTVDSKKHFLIYKIKSLAPLHH
jgi:hypothetical protein